MITNTEDDCMLAWQKSSRVTQWEWVLRPSWSWSSRGDWE